MESTATELAPISQIVPDRTSPRDPPGERPPPAGTGGGSESAAELPPESLVAGTDRKRPARGLVLKWQRGLIEHLIEEEPPNHTRIVAVAAALVTHANADGTRCRPGLRRLGAETGQHPARVGEAIDWLLDAGWLTLARRVAHGGREFTLTIPQRSGDEHAGDDSILYGQRSGDEHAGSQRSGDEHAGDSSVRSASGQRSGDEYEPPTSVPPKSARSDDDEFEEWVQERTRAKGGGAGLADKIRREDRWLYEQERREHREHSARAGCPRCDSAGLVWFLDDGTKTTPDDPEANTSKKCTHRKEIHAT